MKSNLQAKNVNTAFVTGSSGFIGSALTRHLKDQGFNIVTTGRENDRTKGDIVSKENVARIFGNNHFDLIFHLAARTTISESWQETARYFQTNVIGTLNLLEELKAVLDVERIPFVLASSSSVYGNKYSELIREDFANRPVHPYGVTKSCAEALSMGYFYSYGVQTRIARPFYITGYGCPRGVVSEVARTIAMVESGSNKVVSVGNTDAVIDVVDVRDCVMALQVIAKSGKSGEVYNISSGRGNSIGSMVEALTSKSKKTIRVEKSETKIRRQDVNFLVGDPTKLQNIGWSRKYSLDQTLESVLKYWRQTINPKSS